MISIKTLKNGQKVTGEQISDNKMQLFADGDKLDIADKHWSGWVVEINAGTGPDSITHRIGNVGLTTREAKDVKAQLGTLPKPPTEGEIARRKIVRQFDAARRYQDSDYGKSLNLRVAAQEALGQWRIDYPEEAAAEEAKNAKARAVKDAQLAQSFVARGLD